MHLRAVRSGARGAEPNHSAPSPAVLAAVATIREHYPERLRLDRLSTGEDRSAFRFSRLFARETGLTPGRFLTAVRLFEAKRLLLTTPQCVAAIVNAVGYPSVGAFTSHFVKAVGLSPSQYRDPAVREMLVAVAPRLTRMPSVSALYQAELRCGAGGGSGSVTARITLPRRMSTANVLLGLFADPVPQSGPVAFTALPGLRTGDRATLCAVPPGRWYPVAIAEDAESSAGLSVGSRFTPIGMSPGEQGIAQLSLRTPRPTDAPIAFTLACPHGDARHDAARPALTAAA